MILKLLRWLNFRTCPFCKEILPLPNGIEEQIARLVDNEKFERAKWMIEQSRKKFGNHPSLTSYSSMIKFMTAPLSKE